MLSKSKLQTKDRLKIPKVQFLRTSMGLGKSNLTWCILLGNQDRIELTCLSQETLFWVLPQSQSNIEGLKCKQKTCEKIIRRSGPSLT